MMMVVEFHSVAGKIQMTFIFQINILKGFFDILKELLVQSHQKLDISRVQSQFLMPNTKLIFLKMIFFS
jgi:hypothetical protein